MNEKSFITCIKSAVKRELSQHSEYSPEFKFWLDVLADVLIVERGTQTNSEKFFVSMRRAA